MKLVASFLIIALIPLAAQVGPRSTVLATGTASVSATPDQAQINVAAVTQAATAVDATTQNATIASNIITQLTQALGASGTVKTVSYSVNPTYNNQGTLTGYTVTNSIQATLNDLTITGKIIDTAVQAGATRIDSLQFTLKDDSTARAQALAAATIKAKALATAMATAAGLTPSSFVTIQQAGAAISNPITAGAPTATTPIQTGTLTITGTVTVEMLLGS